MRKLNALLTLPLALGLLAGTAIAGEKAKANDGKVQRLEAGPDKDGEAILPVHRRGKVNQQSQGRPPVIPLPADVGPKGESVYTQGVLESIVDGAMYVRYKGKRTDPPNKKALKRFRIANLKSQPMSVLAKKVGQTVRLEIKRDANGQPYVMNVLTPR